MMKKIFIVGLIVCSFFVVSISSVLAAEQPIIINDPTGDVLDYSTGEVTTSNPNINVNNIDITKLTYSRQGASVTLTLVVNGIIENRGNLSDLDADEANVIVYIFAITNSTILDSYTVYYVNNECQISYESADTSENITASSFSAAGSTLTVSFNLLNDSETYDDISAETTYYRLTLADESPDYLYDDAPDVQEMNVTISAPSTGLVDHDINFLGSATGGQSPYEWAWNFNDSGTADTQNAVHAYDAAGRNEVILTVTDSNGNQATASFNITISESGTSDGGNNGGNTNSQSSNTGLIVFVVVIAVIVIAGIAIVIYIIRR